MKTLEEYMSLPYRIEIIPDNEEGGYAACYPELRGCVASGGSFEEVIAAAKEAKRWWLENAVKNGLDIPLPDLSYRNEILQAAAKFEETKSGAQWKE